MPERGRAFGEYGNLGLESQQQHPGGPIRVVYHVRMADDIFSRFRGPAALDDDDSGSEHRRTGGLAHVQESEVLDAIDRVPALPHVVSAILTRVGSETSTTADFEGLIEQDMVLAGRVLKLVNSAFYRRSQPVGSIREAVSVIGFASLRSLVLAASTSNLLLVDLEPYGMSRGGLWKNAIATAGAARSIGVRSGAGADLAEEFFAAGLLRDVGMLVLSPFLARSGAMLRRVPGIDILAAERRLIGFDHCWVGERLAEKWQLPPALRACIGRHHRDASSDLEASRRHLGSVRLAERLVYAAGVGVLPDHPFESQVDSRLIKGGGLDAPGFAALCAEIPNLVKDTEPPA
jgi:HD-like signal output (HDOD) protein